MGTPPSPPSPDDVSTFASISDWLKSWGWGAVGAIFGGGVTYGTLRSNLSNLDERLGRLEKEVPETLRRLEDKIDSHHEQLINMIVNLASERRAADVLVRQNSGSTGVR